MSTIVIFAIITFFLIVKLNEIIGMDIGFKISKGRLQDFAKADTKDVSELDSKIEAVRSRYKKFDQTDFLNKSQRVFEMVFKAYSKGDKSTLKGLLAPRIYSAFSMAIDDRKKRNETLEGNLVGVSEVKLVDAEADKENIFVTVKFITEQSNALKSADGTVLEGSLDFVETRTDVWVFFRKTDSSDPRWFLYEIKSEE